MIFSVGQVIGVKAVRIYKLVVSPWLPPSCRFVPTCSDYALDAIEQYGLIRGTTRALARLLRCHPLHRGGFDPLT
jgi:putative membrane protein insertion efficiency factor